MKTRFGINCIALSLVLMFAFSCSDQLEITPTSSIGVDGFWESQDQASGGIVAMYHRLRAFSSSTYDNIYMLGAARSEEMGWTQTRNPAVKIQYFENTLSASNANMDWQTPYKIISLANLAINNIPDIDFPNEQTKNRYLAEAYSMRAFVYFVLARSWGDVPLETEAIEGYDPETVFKERRPVEEIFDFIKSDIDRALDLFPDDQLSSNKARWSRPAVNTLKGDVYLWTGKVLNGGTDDISIALDALLEVENANVQLLDDFSDVFDHDNKGNDEIIFSIHLDVDEIGNSHYLRMYALDAEIVAGGEEAVDRYGPGAGGGAGWWGPSEHIVDLFNDHDDPRADASFAELPNVLMVTKFKGTIHEGTRRAVDDIIIYRYADLLLLIAEAKNALGQDPTAEINMVRERAHGENFDQEHEFLLGSQEENDEAILQERLFELAFEGKRWWDLVRFDKAYELVPSLQGREDVPLLMPLDEETLTRNSRLTQTLGY